VSTLGLNPKLLTSVQRQALEAICLAGLSRWPTCWHFRPSNRNFAFVSIARLQWLGLCKILRRNGPPHCVPTKKGRHTYSRMMQR